MILGSIPSTSAHNFWRLSILKTVDELLKENTLKEPKIMYEELFNIPCYHRTKRDIAYAIYQYHQDTKRTEDLCKNLYYL